MTIRSSLCLFLSLALQVACSETTTSDDDGSGGSTSSGGATSAGGEHQGDPGDSVSVDFDFSQGAQGWAAGFSDFSTTQTDLELDSGIQPLPDDVGSGQGFMVQSHNRSDDVFMFLTRSIGPAEGLEPDRHYTLAFEIVFASDAHEDCFGIGGAPAESVYLKAGGSTTEPEVIVEDDYYIMSVDKGDQSQGGPAASVAGHVGNGEECGDDFVYKSVTRTHTHDVPVKTSADGTLWLLVGTDSGFEGLTRLYYQAINIKLTPTD